MNTKKQKKEIIPDRDDPDSSILRYPVRSSASGPSEDR